MKENYEDLEEVPTKQPKRYSHNNNHAENKHEHGHKIPHDKNNPLCKYSILGTLYRFIVFLSLTIFTFVLFAYFILIVKQIKYPSIFFPAIIVIITSIISGGGSFASYTKFKGKTLTELAQMRKTVSLLMTFLSVIILPITIYQTTNLFTEIFENDENCSKFNETKGNSLLIANSKRENLGSLKSDLIYKFSKGLTCLENEKCIETQQNSSIFICNNINLKKYKECTNLNEITGIIGAYNNKNLDIFIKSCEEVKGKNNTDGFLYKCINKNKDYVNDHSQNYEDDKIIQKYYDTKIQEYNREIIKLDSALRNEPSLKYTFQISCLTQPMYKLNYSLLITYLISFGFLCGIWVYIGILNSLKIIGFKRDIEKEYIKNIEGTINNQNINNIKKENNNSSVFDEEILPINK